MSSKAALMPTLQLFRAVDLSRGGGSNNSSSNSNSRPSFLETHCDVAVLDCTFESGAFVLDDSAASLVSTVSHIVDKLPQTVVVLVLRVESSPAAAALIGGQQGAKTTNFAQHLPNRVLCVVLPPTNNSASNSGSSGSSGALRHSADSNTLICGSQVSPVVRALTAALDGCNTALRTFLQVAAFVVGRFQLRMAPSTFAEMLLLASQTSDAQALAVLSSICTTHVESQLETAVQSNAVLSPFLGREHLHEYQQFLEVDVAAGSAECGVQLSQNAAALHSKHVAPCNVDVVVVLDCHSNFLAGALRRAVLDRLSDYDRVAIFSAGSVVQVPAFCKDISKLELKTSNNNNNNNSDGSEHVRTGAVHNSISSSLSAAQHVAREWCQSAESRGSRRQGLLLLVTDGSEDSHAATTSRAKGARQRSWESAAATFGCSGHVVCLGRAQVRDMLPLAAASFGSVVDIPPSAGRAVPEADVPMVADAAGIIVGKLLESQRNCVASMATVLVRAKQNNNSNENYKAKLGTVAEFHNSCEISRTCSVVAALGPVTQACRPRWFGSARKDEQLPRNFDPECTWDVFVAFRAHSSGPAFLLYRQLGQEQWQQLGTSGVVQQQQQQNNNNTSSSSSSGSALLPFPSTKLSHFASWAHAWNRLNDALFGPGKATAAPLLQQWDSGALRRAFESLNVPTVRRLDAYRGFLKESHSVTSDETSDGATTTSSNLWASPQSLFERAVLVARSQLVGSVFADVAYDPTASAGLGNSPNSVRRSNVADLAAAGARMSPARSVSPSSVASSPSQQRYTTTNEEYASVNRSPPRRPPTGPSGGSAMRPPAANNNNNNNENAAGDASYMNSVMMSPNVGARSQNATPNKKVRIVTAEELAATQQQDHFHHQQQQQQQYDLPSMSARTYSGSNVGSNVGSVPPPPPHGRSSRDGDDDGDGGNFQARVTMLGRGEDHEQQQQQRSGGGGLTPGVANNASDAGIRRGTRIHTPERTRAAGVTVSDAAQEPPHSSALVDPRWLQLDSSRPKSATVEAALCRCLPAGRVVTDASFALGLAKFESGNVFLKLNPLPPLASYGSSSGNSSGLARRVFLFSVDSSTGDLDILQTASVRESDRAVCFEKVNRGSHCAAIFVVHEDRPKFKGGGWISMGDFLVVDGIEFETPSFFAKSVDVWDVRQNQANFRWEGIGDSFVITLRALASVGGNNKNSTQVMHDGENNNNKDDPDFCAPITTVISDGRMSTTIDSLRPFTVYWVQVAPSMMDVTMGQRTKVETANGIFATAPSLTENSVSVVGCSIPASSATALIKLTAPRFSQVVNWATSASGARTTYAVAAEPVLMLGVNELKRDVHATAVESKNSSSNNNAAVASVVDPLDAPTWHFRSEVPLSTVLPLQVIYNVSLKQVTDGTATAATVKSWRTERLLQFPVGPFSFLRGVRVSSVRANAVTITWSSDPFAKFLASVTRTSRKGMRRVKVVDDDGVEQSSSEEDEDEDENNNGPSAVHIKGSPLPGQSSADICTFRATLPDLKADTGYTIRVAGHGCLNPEKLLVRTTPAAPTVDDVNPTHDYIQGSVAVLLAPASRFEEIHAIGGEDEDDSSDDDDDNTAPDADTTDIRKLAKRQQRLQQLQDGHDQEEDTARVMKHVEIVATVLPVGAEVWSDDASAHVESTLPVNSKSSWAISVTREVVFADPKLDAPIRGRALPEMPSLVSDPLELFVVLDVQVEVLVLNRQLDVLFRSRRIAGSPITATLGSTTSDTMAVKRKELDNKKRQFQQSVFQETMHPMGQQQQQQQSTSGGPDTIRGDALHSLTIMSKQQSEQLRRKHRNERLRAGERSASALSASDNDEEEHGNGDDEDDDFAPLHRASFALPRRQEGDAIGSLLRFSSPQLVSCSTRFFALLSSPDLTPEDIYSRVFEDRVELTIPAAAPVWSQLTHDGLYQCSGVAPGSSGAAKAKGLPMFDRADIRPYVKWHLCVKTAAGVKRFPLQLPMRKGDPRRESSNSGKDNNSNNNNVSAEPGDPAHEEAAAAGVFHAPTFTVPLNPQRSSSNVEELYLQLSLEPYVDHGLAATQALVCVNGGAAPRSKNPLHIRCPVVYDIRSLQLESCRPVLRGGGAASTMGGGSRVNVRPSVSDDNGKCLVRWHSAAPEFEVSVKDVGSAQVLQTVRTSAKNAELPVYPGRAVIISVSGPACGGHEVSMVVHFPGKHAPPVAALQGMPDSARGSSSKNKQQQQQDSTTSTPRNTLSVEPNAGAIVSTSQAPSRASSVAGGDDEQQDDVIKPFFVGDSTSNSNNKKNGGFYQQPSERENIPVVDESSIQALLDPPAGAIQLISTSPDFRSARLCVPPTATKKVKVLASTWPHGSGTVEVTTKHIIRRSDAPSNDLVTSSDGPQQFDEETGEPIHNEVEIPLWADVGDKLGAKSPVRLPHFLRYSVSVCRFTADSRPDAAPVTFPAVEGLPERIDVVLEPRVETVDPNWLAVSWAGSADLYDVVGWIVAENETPSLLDVNESAAAFMTSGSFGVTEVIRCQRDVPRVSLSVAQLQGKLLMLRVRSVVTHNGVRVSSGGLCSNTLAVSVLVPLPPPLLSCPIIRAGLFACKLPRPHLLRDSGGTVHAGYSINDGRGHAVSSESGTRIGISDFFSVHLRLPIVTAPTRDATVGTCLPCTVSLVRKLTLAPAHEPLRIFRCLNDGVESTYGVSLPELHGLESLRVASVTPGAFELEWTSTASTFDISITALIGSEAHLQRRGNTFFGGTTRHVRVSEPKFSATDCMSASIYLVEIRSLQCGDAVLRGALVTQPAFAAGTALVRRDKAGARCSLDIECNSEPMHFCLDNDGGGGVSSSFSDDQQQQQQQSWTVVFEDTIELKRLSGAIETLSLNHGECIGVGKHKKPCYTFNVPISSAITEIYWKKSARVILNNNNNNSKKNKSKKDGETDDDQQQENDEDNIETLLASVADEPLRQDEDPNTSAALAMEHDLLKQTRSGGFSLESLHENNNNNNNNNTRRGGGGSATTQPFAKPEQYRILHRIGVSTINLCSVPFIPRIDGFVLGDLHAQRAQVKWSCTAPTSAIAGFSVQATALAVLPFRELSQSTVTFGGPRQLRSARGSGGGGGGNNSFSGADVTHAHSTAHGPNSGVLLGSVQTRVMSVDGGGDRQVNLVGLHPGALHEVIVRAELQGGNAVSIVPKYSSEYPDVLTVEDESSGCPEGTCFFLTPPIRPIALPYRRYTGCVEAIFDGKRLAGARHGLLGYVAVRAVPDNLVFVAAPPGESAQHSDAMPPCKLALKSDTTTFVVARGCDTVNDQLAVVQWHVQEPADSATHMLEHYTLIEAVEGHTPPHIWRNLLNRAAWSEPEEQPVRLLRAVSRPLITTAGSDRLDVCWTASHGELRFDVTYTNLTPSQGSNRGGDDLGSEMPSQNASPAITPVLSNFDAAQNSQFPNQPDGGFSQQQQQQQHVVRVAQNCATLEHLTNSSLYVVDVCASHDDVPCQPTSFVALTAPKRRKPPRIHCVGLNATFELPKSFYESVLIPHRVAASAGAVDGSQVPSALTLSGIGGATEVTRSCTGLVFTLPEDPAMGLGPLRDCRTAAEYLALADGRNTFRSHPDAAQRVEVQLRAGRSYLFCFFWSVHNPNAINTVAHSKVVVVEHRADVMAPSNLHVITRTRTSITVGWVPPDRSSPGQQFEVECSICTQGGAGGVMMQTESSMNKQRLTSPNKRRVTSPTGRGGRSNQQQQKDDKDAPKVFTAVVGGPLPDGTLPAVLKTHHTFIGLDEKHCYNFRVRSISQHGAASPWCAVPLVGVPVLMQPRPVDNIDVLSVTDTGITLSWTDTRNTVAGGGGNGAGGNVNDVQSADIMYTVAFRSEVNIPSAPGNKGGGGRSGDGDPRATGRNSATSRGSNKAPMPPTAQQQKEERMMRKAMSMAHSGETVTAHRFIELTEMRPNTKYVVTVTPKNHLGETCGAGNANVTVRTAGAATEPGVPPGGAAAAAGMF